MPDIPGYKTLKCDLHMHTVFSDGDVWPTIRVMEAFRDGLDAISITDHASYNPKKDDVKMDLGRPYAIAGGMAAQLGIMLVNGIEVNDGNTHFNAIFLKDPQALVGAPLKEALIRAKQQGGFAWWNHPGWKGPSEWSAQVADLHRTELFGGMELVNGPTVYEDAYPWIEERKLAILATSDVHRLITDQYGKRGRPVTLAFARTPDEAGLKEALQARRTAAWMNGEVWGFEPQLAALWRGAVKAGPAVVKGGAQAGLMLHNTSALPFRLKLVKAPAWLRSGNPGVAPEAVTGVVLTFAKDAPAGLHRVELEYEVTNFHTGPGRNLMVTLPVNVRIAR